MREKINEICQELLELPLDKRIAALNEIRQQLHQVSPFAGEPVDCVLWVSGDKIAPNTYNPNYVASTEMALLTHSIEKYHYAMPIVVHEDGDGGAVTVVDGEHRHKIGTGNSKIRERLHGYLPIAVLPSKSTQNDLVAATIDFNRARGEHKVMSMGQIVRILVTNGWDDARIAKEVGMSVEEILRLKQVRGIAASRANREYGKSWVMKE